MGAVAIETYNAQLMAIANYENAGQLKHLLRNYNNLYGLSQRGDGVAQSIYIDLKTALEANALTDLQALYIREHLIEGMSLEYLSNFYGVKRASVADSVKRGLSNLQKVLQGGNLYARS
jgi:hypothetical protein